MKNRRTPSTRDRQFDRVRHTAQGILVLAGVATGTGVGLIAHGAKAATTSSTAPSTTTTTTSSTSTTTPGHVTTTTLYIPPTTVPVTTTTVCYSTPSGNVRCY
jgi:hypothetical protein